MVTVEDMRSKLLTVDQARERLAATEPLDIVPFMVGNAIRFTVNPGWQHGLAAKSECELLEVHCQIGKGRSGVQVQLTKEAVMDVAGRCGMVPQYTAQLPSRLLEDSLNFWYREGMLHKTRRGAKICDLGLVVMKGQGIGIISGRSLPYSNVALLDAALDGIAKRYGGEVLVDYKFTHTPRRTRVRLIVPDRSRIITGTDVDGDQWSVGLQLSASQIGVEPVIIDGYLFRWWCTNGAIDTKASSGKHARKRTTERLTVEVLNNEAAEWARSSVDDVFTELEHGLDAVQAMVGQPIEGSAADVLRDVFEQYVVPLDLRPRIIDVLVAGGGELSMYSVMAAITQVANDAKLRNRDVEKLLRLGGDLPHAAQSRCEACRRLTKH